MATRSESRFDVSALDRASQVFTELGRTVERLEKRLDALDRAKAEPRVDVDTSRAERSVGSFAADMRKRLTAAVKALPEIELKADASDADRQIQLIRRQLAELSDLEIGVDINANDAEARLRLLQSELADISERSTNIQLKADATQAVAALGKIRAEIDESERAAGAFATFLDTRVSGAIRSLPDIEITADSTDADYEISRIRGELVALSDKRIGIDIDADAAVREVDRLQSDLDELSRSSPNVQVRADTAAAWSQLQQVKQELRSLDGWTVRPNVDSTAIDAASRAMVRLSLVMSGIAVGSGLLAAGPALLSLASSAVAAAGALGTVPAALGAAGAVFGTFKIGLTGMSDAFDALGKADTASAASAGSNASARQAAAERIRAAEQTLADAREAASRQAIQSAQQVAAAQQAVSDAIRQADQRAIDSARAVSAARAAIADAIESAARRVEAAEASLERAQLSGRDAQVSLNRAREEAKERIEDLTLALSGAALSEEAAQVRLERAQERLAKLAETGGSKLDFREAELGIRQAQQALLEVKERYADVKAEADDANRKGVAGADNVVAAQRRVDDANRTIADSERNLQQAREDGAKGVAAAQDRLTLAQEAQRRSAEESARAIARAEEALGQARAQQALAQQDSMKAIARAQEQVAQAIRATSDSAGGGAGAVDKYAEALAKLSPNARAFMETIRELKPRWDELTRAVQNNLFAGVAEQTKVLADIYLPKLQTLFGGIATSVNRAALETGAFFAQESTANLMQGAFDRIGVAIDIAAQAVAPLVEALTQVFAIGTEFLGPMAEGFRDLAIQARDFTRSAEGQQKIREWIEGGLEALKKFGQLFWNTGGIIMEILGGADRAGVDFLQTLVDLTGRAKEFLRSPEGNDLLARVFDSIKRSADALKPGLEAIWNALKDAVREIAPKIPGVADSFSRLAEGLAPILSDIAVVVFNAFAAAFDILSRVPAPVLVALAGAFIAFKGLQAAKKGADSLMDVIGAFKSGGTFRNFIGDLDSIIGKLTGTGGILEGLLGIRRESDDLNGGDGGTGGGDGGEGGRGGRGRGRFGKVVAGAGKLARGLGGIGSVITTADMLLPDEVGEKGSIGQEARDDLKGWADSINTLFEDPLGELSRQWDDFWGELGGFPAAFDQSPFMQFWRGIPTWWQDSVWGPLTGGASVKWDEFVGWWAGVGESFRLGWDGFWGGVGSTVAMVWENIKLWVSEKWTAFTTWLGEQWTAFSTGWNEFWGGLGAWVATVWDNINLWVNEKWTALTTWLGEQWTAFTTGWNEFWDAAGRKVTEIWDNINLWVSERWNAFTTWLSERWAAFTEGWHAFWDGVGAWAAKTWDDIKLWVSTKWNELVGWLGAEWARFTAGWNGFWDAAGRKAAEIWDNIKLWVSTKWTEMTTWLQARWLEFQAGWNGMWDAVGRFFSDRWEDIKRIAAAAWNWLRTTVWDPLIRFVTVDIPAGFNRAVDAVRTAWDRIKEIAAIPVRFIVNTVYNQGIVPAWNSLADIVGLPHAGTVNLGFARGGILPGYTPGRDVHTFYSPTLGTLGLSGGEAILRPEVARGMGPAWVDQINRVARVGGARAVQSYIGNDRVHEYANGGIIGRAGMKATRNSAVDRDQIDPISLFTDAVGAVRALFAPALGQAGATPGVSQWRDAVAKIPGKLVDGAIAKIQSMAANLFGGIGGGAGGGGWQWQMQVLREVFPGLQLISGFRPGAITATGNRSYHSMGRAVDIPPRMDVFNWIRGAYGANTRELIFSPAGGAQIHNGRPHVYTGVTKANHWDHVHWAYRMGGVLPDGLSRYDKGGMLRPGTTFAENRTGRPERVLSPTNTASFDRLVASLDRTGRARGMSQLDGGVVPELQALRGDVRALQTALGDARGLTYAPTINNPVAEPSAATKASDLRTAVVLKTMV